MHFWSGISKYCSKKGETFPCANIFPCLVIRSFPPSAPCTSKRSSRGVRYGRFLKDFFNFEIFLRIWGGLSWFFFGGFAPGDSGRMVKKKCARGHSRTEGPRPHRIFGVRHGPKWTSKHFSPRTPKDGPTRGGGGRRTPGPRGEKPFKKHAKFGLFFWVVLVPVRRY